MIHSFHLWKFALGCDACWIQSGYVLTYCSLTNAEIFTLSYIPLCMPSCRLQFLRLWPLSTIWGQCRLQFMATSIALWWQGQLSNHMCFYVISKISHVSFNKKKNCSRFTCRFGTDKNTITRNLKVTRIEVHILGYFSSVSWHAQCKTLQQRMYSNPVVFQTIQFVKQNSA